MSGNKPCCAAAAAAQLRYLVVGGNRIAIARLDETLERAEAAAPGGEGALRKELVRLVRMANYIPAAAEKDYEDALLAEYLARKGRGNGSGKGGSRGKGK